MGVLNEMAATATANSRRWFPVIHGRGIEAEILHAALGVAAEAGEVQGVVKRLDAYGYVIALAETDPRAPWSADRDELAEEIVDTLTYLLNLAGLCGLDLDAALVAKTAKCERRFERRSAGLAEKAGE